MSVAPRLRSTAQARIARRTTTRRQRRRRRRTWFLAVAQLATLAIVLLPVLWLYLASLRTNADIRTGSLLPEALTLENFSRLLRSDSFARPFLNSLIVAFAVAMLTVVVSTMAAYGLARFRFRGRGLVGGIVLGALMVPWVVALVPLIVMLREVHLADTLQGLVVAHLILGIPVATWLLRSYIDDVPAELEEAALVDGCTRWGALWRIVVPLIRPAIAAVGAFSFILSWGEYLIALSLLTSDQTRTLPLAMQGLFELHDVDLGVLMAFGVVISLPVAVMFIGVQRQLVSGLTAGGVK
jgi:ABC-type glycerol-3-phosphate transport system permease component